MEELHKTIKLAGAEADPFLAEAERFLEQARQYNQDFQFDHTEAALNGVEQKLAEYEQRKQGSEELREKIQDLLNEVRNLGENDPQSSRLNSELIQLLPKIESDYEETEAIFKQNRHVFSGVSHGAARSTDGPRKTLQQPGLCEKSG